jgi:hypothetical protein
MLQDLRPGFERHHALLEQQVADRVVDAVHARPVAIDMIDLDRRLLERVVDAYFRTRRSRARTRTDVRRCLPAAARRG